MVDIREWLKGKKTYIVAALMVLVAIVNFLAGDMGLVELLQDPYLMVLLNGAGFAALRAGVANSNGE